MTIYDVERFPNPIRIRIALAAASSIAAIKAFAGLAFVDIASVDISGSLGNLHGWRAKVAACPSIAASAESTDQTAQGN